VSRENPKGHRETEAEGKKAQNAAGGCHHRPSHLKRYEDIKRVGRKVGQKEMAMNLKKIWRAVPRRTEGRKKKGQKGKGAQWLRKKGGDGPQARCARSRTTGLGVESRKTTCKGEKEKKERSNGGRPACSCVTKGRLKERSRSSLTTMGEGEKRLGLENKGGVNRKGS